MATMGIIVPSGTVDTIFDDEADRMEGRGWYLFRFSAGRHNGCSEQTYATEAEALTDLRAGRVRWTG